MNLIYYSLNSNFQNTVFEKDLISLKSYLVNNSPNCLPLKFCLPCTDLETFLHFIAGNDLLHKSSLIHNIKGALNYLSDSEKSRSNTIYFINEQIALDLSLDAWSKRIDLSKENLFPMALVIPEHSIIENPWGDEIDDLTLIKRFSKANIWHEVLHLIGVTDHYNPKNHEPLDICTDKFNCLMTYGKDSTSLCSYGFSEINAYMSNIFKLYGGTP